MPRLGPDARGSFRRFRVIARCLPLASSIPSELGKIRLGRSRGPQTILIQDRRAGQEKLRELKEIRRFDCRLTRNGGHGMLVRGGSRGASEAVCHCSS